MSRTPPRRTDDPQGLAAHAAGVRGGLLPPITAGVVSALVGFSSAFVIVLSGLTAVGANRDQASSGLLAVSVAMGLACIVLSWQTRLPITAAWSTPGAALLATTGTVDGGWSSAVGAFLVTGVLIVLTGLVSQLGALVTRIPTSIAQAMLAGVLLQLCLGPITGLAANPLAVTPVVVVWLAAQRFSPRWAAPLAFLAAAVVIVITLVTGDTAFDPADLVPRIDFTAPTFTVAGVVGIALPLYLVTMASQNIPGVAVMAGLGYQVPWRRSMIVTGFGTLFGATAGGHAINLAAISAALAAGPEAGEDRSRRWIASLTAGMALIVLGVASALFGTLVALAPVGVIAAVAGLALLGTLAASLTSALTDPVERVPAVITFVTAASGTVIFGVSAAFWALVAGLVARFLTRERRSAA